LNRQITEFLLRHASELDDVSPFVPHPEVEMFPLSGFDIREITHLHEQNPEPIADLDVAKIGNLFEQRDLRNSGSTFRIQP
jgi:hypothetical protein